MAFEGRDIKLDVCPGKTDWFAGKAPVMLRGGKAGPVISLGLVEGHEVVNGDANEMACLMVKLVLNDPPQGTPLLAEEATHAAWLASVANILEDNKMFSFWLSSCIAPVYADVPFE